MSDQPTIYKALIDAHLGIATGRAEEMREHLRLQIEDVFYRPRRFESNVPLFGYKAPRPKFPLGVYGTKPDGRTTYRYRNAGNYQAGVPGSAKKSLIRAAKSIEEAREAMGIDWMVWDEIRESIPPTYTEFIGRQVAQHIRSVAAV